MNLLLLGLGDRAVSVGGFWLEVTLVSVNERSLSIFTETSASLKLCMYFLVGKTQLACCTVTNSRSLIAH
ncbi:MAG: hypothetical protein KME57_24155 [Scytonema hyalinum WJT4-NPBG1]|nr:hypothetical protein [Scytonema hyalinum WJT4-NPBG1]